MKNFVFALAAASMLVPSLCGSMEANAQKGRFGVGQDSVECVQYLSYYKEYYKQKNYDDALPNWRKAYAKCPPTASHNMLIDGGFLVRRLIAKNAADKEYRAALVDTLMTIYDVRAENYPKMAVSVRNNKGTDVNNYFKNDHLKIYTELSKIIEANGEKTKPSLLLIEFNSAVQLYGEGRMNAEQVIKNYQDNIALLDRYEAKSEMENTQKNKIRSDMEGIFIGSKVASCDNLIALFTPRFEAAPDDMELVSNIVKMMSSTEDCTNNDLYLKAATTMHRNQPSAQSAYFLYRLNNSRGNSDEAAAFMEEAIASASDDATAAGYNYEYATFCLKNNKPQKAYAAAQKAAEQDKSFIGRSYFLMGTIWGTTSCGGDEISRRAPYWVACDYMQKAKAADPTLTDECNRMIGQYSVYFPKTADAFMYNLENGQSYTVSCGGMRATTTVRTQR